MTTLADTVAPPVDASGVEAMPGAPAFAAGPVLAIAGVAAALMLALATRYGYHRDELYYLAGGERAEWGYVDHPPLTPWLAHAVDALTGGSLLALRSIGVAITFVGVVAGGWMARELGGGRRAQVLAAFAIAASPMLRGPNALIGTTGMDQLVWIAVLLLVLRLLRTGRTRWWLPIGVAVGVGLETKWTVLVLVAGLLVGIAVARRELLWSPWLVAGIAAALVLWAPNLWWNAQHDWAALEFQRGVRDRQSGIGGRVEYVVGQLLLTGILTIVIWWPGLRWLLRRGGAGRAFRPVGIAAIVVVLAFFLVGGKMYYSTPIYLPLFAAGCVVLEAATWSRRRLAIILVVVAFVASAPATIPLLPPSALGAIRPINKELGEMVGWPELTGQVRAAVATIPPDERARTVVLTANYGEAAALERFAPELRTYSGQNSYWLWGPPPDDTSTVVLVGFRASAADPWCGSITMVGTIANDAGLSNDEAGRPLLICRDLRHSPADLWPLLRHFD